MTMAEMCRHERRMLHRFGWPRSEPAVDAGSLTSLRWPWQFAAHQSIMDSWRPIRIGLPRRLIMGTCPRMYSRWRSHAVGQACATTLEEMTLDRPPELRGNPRGDSRECRRRQGRLSEAKRRILIVEDNETARKQMQVFLETEPGLSVDTAANGSDALKALAERPYSVVVTDLKMPRVDGLQLLEEVQKRKSARGRDHHHGIWNNRSRGAGDAAGCSRFSDQTNQARTPAPWSCNVRCVSGPAG